MSTWRHPFFAALNLVKFILIFLMALPQSWRFRISGNPVCMYMYMDFVLFFFRHINMCANIYEFLRGQLGKDLYVEDCHVQANKILQIYHSAIGRKNQAIITKRFMDLQSNLRVLVTTVGFGMGVDIPNVQRVIHWGLSRSRLFYWQEVGRAGRDGSSAEAKMYSTHRSMADVKTEKDIILGAHDVHAGQCIRKCMLGDMMGYVAKTKSCTCTCSSKSCGSDECMCCVNCRSHCLCRK